MGSDFGEPGAKSPKDTQQDIFDVFCPVDYCSAAPGTHCMTGKGRFALRTHLRRREASYIKKRTNGDENTLMDL